jgi:hypothetical protein
MTARQLREFRQATPFKPFTIHMSYGAKIKVDDPDSHVVPKGWRRDAIMLYPKGRFRFVHLAFISRVAIQAKRQRGKK